MDKELNTLTGDYTGKTINHLKNAIYIRLKTPLGSWWADASIGSLLHTLAREKDQLRVGVLAKQYAEEALQPIIDDGRAESIHVVVDQPKNSWLYLNITVQTATESFDYRHGVPVI